MSIALAENKGRGLQEPAPAPGPTNGVPNIEPLVDEHQEMTGCHPSCICDSQVHTCSECSICSRCVQPDAAHMVNQDYCQCNTPQYRLKQGSTWECEQVINSTEVPQCEWQLFNQIYYMVIHSKCSFEKDQNGVSIVQDILTYDWRRLSIDLSDECKGQLVTRLLWAKDCQNYVPLDTKYYTTLVNNQTQIRIPLIDIYDLANFTRLTDDGRTIYQVICLAIELGHQRRVIREHRFQIRVYTNRDQVQVFHLTVSKQITEGCDYGQECIVVANLDTVGFTCTDASCTSFLAQGVVPEHIVGEHLYVRIQFADNTYTKYLHTVSVKFVDDAGIYVYVQGTQWWVLRQGLGYTDVDILLFQPQVNATVEVNLKIALQPDQTTRMLAVAADNSSDDEVQQNFKVQVQSSKSPSKTQNSQMAYAQALIFGSLMVTLLVLY